MDAIRIGTPIVVEWAFRHRDGMPFPIENYDIDLYYYTGRGKTRVEDASLIEVGESSLVWHFNPYMQLVTGVYALLLEVSYNGELVGMFRKMDAFALTPCGPIPEEPVVVALESKSDFIPLSEAIMLVRHATDAAIEATLAAREIIDEILTVHEIDSSDLLPFVGHSNPIEDLYEVIPENILDGIIAGTVRRLKISGDIYAVTQAGPTTSGYVFTLASITFGVPQGSNTTPPYIFNINTVQHTFSLTKYTF